MIKRYIEVKFQKEGIHKYPAASSDKSLATGKWDDVSFLGHEHFHYFFFEVEVEVFENDREIEFIQFRRWLERLYGEDTLSLDFQSCEMMAEALIEKINENYPNREITVKVYEDNINGARLNFTP